MNKFTKAGIAGAAALAIAAGGGTYAAWSDYVVESGNGVGADELQLTVAGAPSGSEAFQFDKFDLAPGEENDQENVITGRIGGNDIQFANAYVTFGTLTQDDNGCGGTNAEAVVDPTCGSAGDGGELASQAKVLINKAAVTSDGKCGASLGNVINNVTLAELSGQKLLIGQMTDGQKYCLKMVIQLPSTATNAVMTDTVSFPIRYDLEQVV